MTTSHQYYQRARIEDLLRNIPKQLLEARAGLVWREGPLAPGRDKPPKEPFYLTGKPRSGKLDTEPDRRQLVRVSDAIDAFAHDKQQKYKGVGVALGFDEISGLHLAGIDLDYSYDGTTIGPKAKLVVDAAAGSYTEVSPGRQGIKIFGIGADLETVATKVLEIYNKARFFALTGLHHSGDHLADLTAAAEIAEELLLQHKKQVAGGRVARGQRHNSLISYLGTLRERVGLTDEELEREARAFNDKCDPPLPDAELRSILKSARAWRRGYALNDTGNARRLLDQFGSDLQWVMGQREYIVWTPGDGWRFDPESLLTTALAKDAIAKAWNEVPEVGDAEGQKRLSAHLIGSQNTKKLEAMISNARSEPGVAIDFKLLDANNSLLGLLDGQTLDTRDGKPREARREDLITKRFGCRFDPNATAPLLMEVLRKAVRDDLAMMDYLQQVVGMTLLGNPLRLAFFFHGPTGTSKSILIEVVKEMLGDYACAGSRTLLMERARENRHGPTEEILRLAGRKLVTISEVKQGDKIDDAVLKDLLPGPAQDKLSARNHYKSTVEFSPYFVLMVRCNHKPIFSGDDDAVSDRIHLVPFTVQIPKDDRDPTLTQRIKEQELSGVLNWAIEGALKLQRNKFKLDVPERVQLATQEYAAEMNPIERFIKERCVVGPNEREGARVLHGEYSVWCKENDFPGMTETDFGKKLGDRFDKKRTSTGNEYLGVSLGN